MYKVTIKHNVGDVSKDVTIETEDISLVKEILKTCEVLSVDADIPNRNIDIDWQELMKEFTNTEYFKTPFKITC